MSKYEETAEPCPFCGEEVKRMARHLPCDDSENAAEHPELVGE